jgi:hypothetical protein
VGLADVEFNAGHFQADVDSFGTAITAILRHRLHLVLLFDFFGL